MKKLLLSSSFITLIVMGLNFFFKIYLSYKISKEDIGLFWTFLDVVAVGVMLFSGFKDSLILAFDRDRFQKIFTLYCISFIVLFMLVILGDYFYYRTLSLSYPSYYLISLLIVNLGMIFLSYLNAAHKAYNIMLFENLVMALSLIGSFFILQNFLESIEALFFAYLLSYLSRAFYIFVRSSISWKFEKFSFSEGRDFLRNTLYSGGMYFFSGLFISMSGIIMLKLFEDTVTLGEYQVVVRSIFFSLVAVFVFPLNTFTFPILSKLTAQKEMSEIYRIEKKLSWYLLLFFLLLLASTSISKYIIGFIFPLEYQESYKMLNTLLPMLPFIAATTFYLNIIKGFDRFDLALYVRFFGTLLFFSSIMLFYLLNFDASSIVYSLDISFFGMFLLAYIFKKRVLI